MDLVPIENLTLATFEKVAGQKFTVRFENDHAIELVLTKVVSRGGTALPGGKQSEAFSLMFRGPQSPFLEQKMYSFEQPEIGAFKLFIVPIASNAEGFTYEAVFNRLVNKS
jgi:hypothetical protein